MCDKRWILSLVWTCIEVGAVSRVCALKIDLMMKNVEKTFRNCIFYRVYRRKLFACTYMCLCTLQISGVLFRFYGFSKIARYCVNKSRIRVVGFSLVGKQSLAKSQLQLVQYFIEIFVSGRGQRNFSVTFFNGAHAKFSIGERRQRISLYLKLFEVNKKW